MDLLQLDGVGQLQALQSGQVSARELLEAAVGRADSLSAAINAVVSRDLERARSEAQMIDDRRARGEAVGRLAGLPMTIKDTIDVEGLPASAGLAALLNRTADDAVVVRHVRGEGGVVWGKTNTPVNAADWQTYNGLYGTTNNPWDSTRTPGGSSGGSAVAVATGITAIEIGADIGGSLRIPASFTGVFAHKPTCFAAGACSATRFCGGPRSGGRGAAGEVCPRPAATAGRHRWNASCAKYHPNRAEGTEGRPVAGRAYLPCR